MADFEQRIRAIKVKHKNGEIEKAKAEERIKSLEEQKSKIIEHCVSLGVEPTALSIAINSGNEKLEGMVSEAEEALGITDESEESPF